ncbi:alkaline phosphatase family protein [Halorubrum sodomense]|uniref:Predicted phosphohydrolase or phosphomutase, AlkP superfamily n=1 Tax=Halorubrum sodomense TaxID=35743 RepID=A0A1I6FXD4_HALSD|nr:alkaline phosphatase family protein [Halorubrum sodomense]SFR34574.1 Predicted phosphohydrolase or phosphomutase, AlkP superfamily [Halorubrum sodomense]
MDTLVIGLDGGEWDVISPLIADGRLPNLARLKEQGVSGPLESTIPPVSPLAWNSIQTGTNPGKHGVYDFSWFDEDYRRRSINSTDRKATPFWKVMNDHNTSTGLFKIPFTYPPDEVSGYMVTGFPTPSTVDDFAVPQSLSEKVGPVDDLFEDGSLKSEGDLEAFRDNLHDVAEHQTDVFCELLDQFDTDFGMTVYDGSDRVQHFFWKYFDESHPRYIEDKKLDGAIEEYYEMVDKGIGRILNNIDEDCDILVISDHGFGPLTHDIHIDEWLEQEGFLTRQSLSLNTKTVISASIEAGWKTIKRADLDKFIRSIVPASWVDTGQRLKSERRNDVDWEKTDVFFTTLSGQGFFINIEEKFTKGIITEDQYDTLVDEIKRSLQSIQHPETGDDLLENVYEKDEIYEGWAIEDAPDLVAITKPEYTLKGGQSETLLQSSSQKGAERTGDHRRDGILVASGPSFDTGSVENSSVMDIAPTLLYLFEQPVPNSMDGRVLSDLFSAEIQEEREITKTDKYGKSSHTGREWSSEEESELEDRLDDLGYLS